MIGSRLRTGVVGRTLDSVPPAAGAAVMGTGIISVGLSLDRQEVLSRVLLAIAAAIWVTLSVLLPLRAARDPPGFRGDVHTPGACTAPVATAVLGVRLTLLGWTWAGIAALVLVLVLWAALFRPVLAGLKSPTVGVSLLLAVCTEALALIAAAVGTREHARWLLIAALVPFALGLGLYVIIISRFDVRQLAVGAGDQWIAGGAVGISALAAGMIAGDANDLGVVAGRGALDDIALALWVLTMPWLVVLLFAEIRWPRLRYDVRRWSTVFPLGMYAASSFAVGAVVQGDLITSFAQVWVWVALASWAIVSVGTLRRAVDVVRGQSQPSSSAEQARSAQQ